MSFKDTLIQDMQDTFLNVDDFGEQVTLVRSGVEYPLNALYDEPSLDGAAIGAEVQAISHRPRLIVSSTDLPDHEPRKNDNFIISATPFHKSGKFVAKDFVFEKDGSVEYHLQASK